MVKTTIYLPRELKEQLEQVAASENCSEAELIRKALQKSLESRLPPKPTIPLSSEGLGDPSIAERTDELLEGFGRR